MSNPEPLKKVVEVSIGSEDPAINEMLSLPMAADFISAGLQWAEDDADAVAGFFREFHRKSGTEMGSWHPPASFLLALAVALCLQAWERSGFRAYRDAGLPEGRSLLIQYFDAQFYDASEAEQLVAGWHARFRSVQIESMAWAANKLFSSDVELIGVNEDELLDVVADMIWLTGSS